MLSDGELEEIVDYLAKQEGNVYIGCDSRRYKTSKKKIPMTKFVLVLVVHKNNNNGCKVFSFSHRERLYEKNPRNPSYRLMREVQLVSELYTEIYSFIDGNRKLEVHLDINPNKKYMSSKIVTEAIGYVMGQTGIEPKIKPEAFAASRAADALTR